MFRRIALVLGLAIAPLIACKGTENVVGNPAGGPETRTLASMLPFITKTLTAPQAELTFGRPDNAASSGSILFIYNVENGQKVNLGFPNPTDPISFASLQDKNGGTTPIQIKD